MHGLFCSKCSLPLISQFTPMILVTGANANANVLKIYFKIYYLMNNVISINSVNKLNHHNSDNKIKIYYYYFFCKKLYTKINFHRILQLSITINIRDIDISRIVFFFFISFTLSLIRRKKNISYH